VDMYREVLEEARKALGLEGDFKIRVKNMKTKAASISFKSRMIRINKKVIEDDADAIKYLIYHELVHYKFKNRGHGKDFCELLYSKLDEEFIVKEEKKIAEKMLKLNGL
jgi:predicted metal-dependent hydrolase